MDIYFHHHGMKKIRPLSFQIRSMGSQTHFIDVPQIQPDSNFKLVIQTEWPSIFVTMVPWCEEDPTIFLSDGAAAQT